MKTVRTRAVSGWLPTAAPPRVVLDGAGVALWVFDEGRLVAASPSAFESLGYSSNAAWEFPLGTLLHPLDVFRVQDAFRMSRMGSSCDSLTSIRLMGANREVHWVAAQMLLLGPETPSLLWCHQPAATDGNSNRNLSMTPDSSMATDSERLGLLERLATLGTLSAGLVHEINDPLAYVMLSLEQLERAAGQLVDPPERAELMARITDARHGVDRIATLVKDVRSFARREQGDSRPVDVGTLVESAVRLTEHQIRRRARLSLEIKSSAMVQASPVQLEHVFINLLVNASHAFALRGPRGNIQITVSQNSPGQISVAISDTGIGIPQEALEKIFEPFYTTKAEGDGTGLGLAFCRRVVGALGGRIQVSSTVGQGTTFNVELPTVS